MKKILLSTLGCLLAVSTYSQTKQQTVDWLNDKLEEYADSSYMGKFTFEILQHEGDDVIGISKASSSIGTIFYVIVPSTVVDVITTTSCRTDGKRCIKIKALEDTILFGSSNASNLDSEMTIYLMGAPDSVVFSIQKSIKHLLKTLGNEIPEKKNYF